MGLVLLALRPSGVRALPVHFVGKAATFNLLYAFPLLLLGDGGSTAARVALPIGWGFAWWGTVLYWVAGVLYAVQALGLVRARRARSGAAEAEGTAGTAGTARTPGTAGTTGKERT